MTLNAHAHILLKLCEKKVILIIYHNSFDILLFYILMFILGDLFDAVVPD